MPFKKIILLSIVIIFILLLSACQYFKLLSYKEWLETSNNDEVDVYIAGVIDYVYGVGGTGIACYWKVGKNDPVYLENGNPGQTNDIFIYGNDIYISGSYNGVYQSATQKACYWKNGKFISLDAPIAVSFANKIKVINGDVYVTGWIGNLATERACYWKNGVYHQLYFASQSKANGIVIRDNRLEGDIYICGQYMNGSWNACYWKNSNFVSLNRIGVSDAKAYDIYFSYNNDLFVSGHDNDGANNRACYWKNGVQSSYLSPPGNNSVAYSMDIKNSNIYFAGYYVPNAMLWINDDKDISLPNLDSGNDIVIDMRIFNDDIYMCGLGNDGAANPRACWWKNNQSMGLLEDYSLFPARALGIAVKYKIHK